MKKASFLFYLFLALALAPQAGAALVSEVRPLHGVPALFINGQPASQMAAAPYQAGTNDYNDFLRAGIQIYNIYFRFAWTSNAQYNFSRLDARLEAYLKINPKALFIGRVLLTPEEWFAREYPDEITRRDDGSPAGMPAGRTHPSFSSEHYRELSHQAMIALVTHLEEKYGDNIVGYQAGNGFGGEWLPFNSFWEVPPGAPPPAKFGVEDYSPAAKTAFRRWLRDKYKDDESLRRAWGDPRAALASAEPPDEKARYTTPHGIFFDPALSTRVPDFFEFYNDSVAAVLIENCRWLQEITHHQKITGAFYGYLWCNFPNLSAVHSGQLGLTKVLAAPEVNFLASPYTYDNKEIGGPNNSQSLPEAAQLHGKLYFNEVDTETHLQQRQWRWGRSLHLPVSLEETRGLLIRDYAYSLTKGFGLWWTDLFGGDYHDDQIIRLLAALRQVDTQSLEDNKKSAAEIAVVLDESGFMYCGDGEPLFNALLTAQKQWQLGFLGAPWEPQLLSDLDNPNLKNYKLYLFLNTFHVTPAQRDAIHDKLRRNHATAVWVYAPGYITDKLSVESMSALAGIELAESLTAGELHVDITDTNSAYTRGLKNSAYGTDVNVPDIIRYYDHQIYLKDPRDPGLQRDLPGFRISPRFFGADPEAAVLGKLAGLGQPGLVVKLQAGWTSIYSSAPILPADLLRNIARAAGCHIYSDAGDVVSAGGDFLGVYAPGGGSRRIHLPRAARVTDLLQNSVVADGVAEFPLDLAPNASALFKIESK